MKNESMNIVHIVEASFAGVGRHVLDLVESQARSNKVSVIYGAKRESNSFRERRLSINSVDWIKIDVSRGLNLADLAVIRQCRALLSEKNPDVVHGHSTKGGLLARVCTPAHSKVVYTPNAIYSMNPNLSSGSRKLVSIVERKLAKRTDTIICVSPDELEHINGLGVNREKLFKIPNGIEKPKQFEKRVVRGDLGLADKLTVGFVGRLDKQKAPLRLLDIYSVVEKNFNNVQLAVVGDGPLREEAEDYANQIGINSVVWLGEMEGTYAMQAFDIFLLPSDYEGFPYVAIEACACGLPVVATSQSNVSAIVHSRKNGYVIDKNEIESLSEATLTLLRDSNLRQSYSAQSEQIAGKYSSKRMCQTTFHLYRTLLSADESLERGVGGHEF